jgi:hypothetical protein
VNAACYSHSSLAFLRKGIFSSVTELYADKLSNVFLFCVLYIIHLFCTLGKLKTDKKNRKTFMGHDLLCWKLPQGRLLMKATGGLYGASQ